MVGALFKHSHPLICQGSASSSNIYYPSDFIEEEEEEGGEETGKRERKAAVGIRHQYTTLFSSHCRIASGYLFLQVIHDNSA